MSKPTNVLWIGPLHDMTGYAHASNNSLLALNAVAASRNLNVMARPVRLTNQSGPVPAAVAEMVRKSGKPDVIIQHSLPPTMGYIGGAKNIGYFHLETSSFKASAWQYPANLMDQVWMSCVSNVAACHLSDVTPPVKLVKIPLDVASYDLAGAKLSTTFDNHYVFYCIGDWSTRKDMHKLIQAYYLAFSVADPVILVLKTYIDMHSPEQSRAKITQEIEDIKKQMRLGKSGNYPPIVLITNYLPEEKIHALHRMGDCYVTAERGAAWNIPAAEAIVFGNAVITGNYGGPTEYMIDAPSEGLHICTDGKLVPVYGMSHSYDGLYTSGELWEEVSTIELSQKMMLEYNEGKTKYDNTRNRRFKILNETFSLDVAGNEMADHIAEVLS